MIANQLKTVYPNYFEYCKSSSGRLLKTVSHFKYCDNYLCYNLRKGLKEKSTIFKPSEEEWANFWRKMDSYCIWSWEKEYRDPMGGIADGGGWYLEISYMNKIIKTEGDEGFHPENFDGFAYALSELIGIII